MNYLFSINSDKGLCVQLNKPVGSSMEEDLIAISLLIKCTVDSIDSMEEQKRFIQGIEQLCRSKNIQKCNAIKN